MPDEPISNSGVTPTPKVPEYGPDKPQLGANEFAKEPKPFSLPPEPLKEGASTTPSDKPTPMDVAREGAQKQPQMTQEQVSEQLANLKNRLGEVKAKLQDPNVTGRFSQDHYEALNRNAEKMNPDLHTIAKETGGKYQIPQHSAGESALTYITKWLNGSQQTMSNALNFLSEHKTPNPASFLKLQYSVQRAVQRGELFASIVGSTVSGIKTIMSTQLG